MASLCSTKSRKDVVGLQEHREQIQSGQGLQWELEGECLWNWALQGQESMTICAYGLIQREIR